jgi:hypothetical protein
MIRDHLVLRAVCVSLKTVSNSDGLQILPFRLLINLLSPCTSIRLSRFVIPATMFISYYHSLSLYVNHYNKPNVDITFIFCRN